MIRDEDCDVDIPDYPVVEDAKMLEGTMLTTILQITHVRLAKMMSEVLTALYTPNLVFEDDNALLDKIGDLDQKLMELRDSIPEAIRPEYPILVDDPKYNVLILLQHFAYYNVLTCIHRMSVHHPSWEREIRRVARRASPDANHGHHKNPRVYASAALILHAARAQIQLLKHVEVRSHPAVWMIFYYPLAAIITLFVSILQNPAQPRNKADLMSMDTVAVFFDECLEQSLFEFPEKVNVARGFADIAKRVVDKYESEKALQKQEKPQEKEYAPDIATTPQLFSRENSAAPSAYSHFSHAAPAQVSAVTPMLDADDSEMKPDGPMVNDAYIGTEWMDEIMNNGTLPTPDLWHMPITFDWNDRLLGN